MSETLNIDLSNYKDRVGSRVQPGRYKVIVEDAEQDTARSGNTMINLWFRIQGGDFNDATIVDRLVLTEKSLFRVVGFMQAIGLPTPKKKLQINLRNFIGKPLEIDVEDGEPYNGRVKSEVRGYNRATGSAKKAESTGGDFDGVEEASALETPEDVTKGEAVEGDIDLDTVDL